jgi:transcriptional regulator with XRE-family HTH domain
MTRPTIATTESAPAKAGGPHPVDVHVGRRVRHRRTLLGLSQEKLGEAIGLTFQQVQKYERGANRISASRLYILSHVLDVPVSFFFDDLPAVEGVAPTRPAADDVMCRRETLELVRAYYAIPDEGTRKRLVDLVRAVGKAGT